MFGIWGFRRLWGFLLCAYFLDFHRLWFRSTSTGLLPAVGVCASLATANLSSKGIPSSANCYIKFSSGLFSWLSSFSAMISFEPYSENVGLLWSLPLSCWSWFPGFWFTSCFLVRFGRLAAREPVVAEGVIPIPSLVLKQLSEICLTACSFVMFLAMILSSAFESLFLGILTWLMSWIFVVESLPEA